MEAERAEERQGRGERSEQELWRKNLGTDSQSRAIAEATVCARIRWASSCYEYYHFAAIWAPNRLVLVRASRRVVLWRLERTDSSDGENAEGRTVHVASCCLLKLIKPKARRECVVTRRINSRESGNKHKVGQKGESRAG